MKRRYLSIRLPYFAIERFQKIQQRKNQRPKPWWDETNAIKETQESSGAPLVLVHEQKNGIRISAIGPAAETNGFYVGMKLNDARAIMPGLRVEQHDVEGDHESLRKLAHWMLRYSPSVAIQGENTLILDTQGCDHLFGGENAMIDEIFKRFSQHGLTAHLALTDTVATSLALTKFGSSRCHILSEGHSIELLDALPVDALRLEPESLVALKRLGLKRIGDVRLIPRHALERRFRKASNKPSKAKTTSLSKSVQWRLDQLSGLASDPLVYIKDVQPYRASHPCPDLALETGAIEIALSVLLAKICAKLQASGKGARIFTLTAYRADGGMSDVSVRLSFPSRDHNKIQRLFSEKLDHINCGFGIDMFILEADEASEIKAIQEDITDNEKPDRPPESLIGFTDAITNRFGGQSVTIFMPNSSHVPERSQRRVTQNFPISWDKWKASKPFWSERPLRLFEHPEAAEVTAELPDSPPAQFIWRKRLRKVIRARGPERILPEWWRDELKPKKSANFRDYYDVEDTDGKRYWIFRSVKETPTLEESEITKENTSETFTATSWYVHGLF